MGSLSQAFYGLPVKTKMLSVIMTTSLLGLSLLWITTQHLAMTDLQTLSQDYEKSVMELTTVAAQQLLVKPDSTSLLTEHKMLDAICLYDKVDTLIPLAASTNFSKAPSFCPIRTTLSTQFFNKTIKPNEYFKAIRNNGEIAGYLYIRFSSQLKIELRDQYLKMSLIAALIIFSLLYMTTIRLEQFLSRRILKLNKTVQLATQEGSYQYLDPQTNNQNDEIGSLISSFNEMAKTIQKAHNQLRTLSSQDALTGLPNHKLFMCRLENKLAQITHGNQSSGLIIVNVGNLRKINTSLGFSYGDFALTTVADRIMEIIEIEDSLSRMGGDEFIILLANANKLHRVRAIVKKICDITQKPIFHLRKRLNIFIHIGIALAPIDAKKSTTLIRLADEAMLDAKKIGPNSFQFFNKNLQKSFMITNDTSENLNNLVMGHALALFLTPQFKLETNTLKGLNIHYYEIDSTIPGSINHLIMDCKDHTTISSINEWLIDELSFLLRKNGFIFLQHIDFLCLNISYLQFTAEHFIEKLVQLSHSFKKLSIEIILTISEENIPTITKFLKEHPIYNFTSISRSGIMFAIESTGTGQLYCLQQLSPLPIKQIQFNTQITHHVDPHSLEANSQISTKEIDHNAIKTGVKNGSAENGKTSSQYLNHLLVELSTFLGYECVAKNIQHKQQAEFFKKINCHYGEGEYFGESIPLSSINTLFTDTSPYSAFNRSGFLD